MKKLFALAIIGLLALGMAGVAAADVDVKTDVQKNVCIDEHITPCIDKVVYLGIKQLDLVLSSAEADVTKNDTIVGNIVVELPVVVPGNNVIETPDTYLPVTPTATINGGAFNTATGISSINQAPGNANNQGNAVALAYANNDSAFLNASSHMSLGNGSSEERNLDPGLVAQIIGALTRSEDLEHDFANLGGTNVVIAAHTPRTDVIDSALTAPVGIISVNQSAGNCNNQDNGVAVAVGGDPSASLAESDLGMITANNIVVELDTTKNDTLTGAAFANAHGILSVNQSSGNCNNQANTVSVTVAALSVF